MLYSPKTPTVRDVKMNVLHTLLSKTFCLLSIFCLGCSFASDLRTPVLVDTDMGLDDVRSITLLLHSNDFRVVGIVVTEGASDTDSAIKNLHQLLAHFNSSHIPIIRGVNLNLPPPPWREHSNAMGWVRERINMPAVAGAAIAPAEPGERIEQLIAESLAFPGPESTVCYLALGPLSTLAHALETHPQLSQRISHVYFSGTGPTLEPSWNRLCDPAAFQAVLDGPWEFAAFARADSEEPALSEAFINKVGRINTRAARFIAALHQAPKIKRLVRAGHLKFWDDIIVLYLSRRNLAKMSVIAAGENEIFQLTGWDAEKAAMHYLNSISYE